MSFKKLIPQIFRIWFTKLRSFIYIRLKYRDKVDIALSANVIFNSHFEGMNLICKHAFFRGSMGIGSYLGDHSSISGKIGRFTSIGRYVTTNHGRHPYKEPYVTTSPCFYSIRIPFWRRFANKQTFQEFVYADNEKEYGVIIGNDCWIGERVFLVGGINIGDGAVVLAGSVVTKDVPPYAVVGGVPAKILNYRYSQEIIDKLLQILWWNKPINWLNNNWESFNNIEAFIKNNS